MSDNLYALLPAVYRRRDGESGEPLRALLALIDAEFEAVCADIETGWDNWFVETAEEWLVPYLAAALRLPVTRDVEAIAFSRRAFVANAIRYRRRKGTAAMMELLARDVTNYPTRAVEFFRRLAATEAINHREGRAATLDIRDTARLERLAGPLGEAARRADVRRIGSGRGTHNLPNLGLFMWRSQIWRLSGTDAAAIPGSAGRGWWFAPTGGAAPLHAPLATEDDPAAVAGEDSVPMALSRRRLWAEARALGEAMRWPFALTLHGTDAGGAQRRDVAPEAIDICHLDPLPAARAGERVRVDPEAGVVLLDDGVGAGLAALSLTTTHFRATPGLIGAGPWARPGAREWLTRWTGPPETREVGFQVLVAREGSGADVVATLDAALALWHAFLDALPAEERGRALGLILIGDSRTYAAPAAAVRVPRGAVLGIVAATWPESVDASGLPPARRRGELLADEVRPLVAGDLAVVGEGDAAAGRGEFRVDGVVLGGALRIVAGDLDALALASTTLLGAEGITIDGSDGANAALEVELVRSIVGAVVAGAPFAALALRDCAVLGAIEAPGVAASADGSTVLGATGAGRLEATDCLFDGILDIEAQQEGCLRFCYLPPGSRAPRRFRCQPEVSLDAAADDAAREAIRIRLRPTFRSRDPFAPGFLLFTDSTPAEIRTGAEDGGEIGCWNHLQHQARVANLLNALPQFLRFGLDPGLFFLV